MTDNEDNDPLSWKNLWLENQRMMDRNARWMIEETNRANNFLLVWCILIMLMLLGLAIIVSFV